MKQNSSKKSSLNAPTRNGAKKTVGSSIKKSTSKPTAKKTTTKTTSSKTVPKVASKKSTSKVTTKATSKRMNKFDKAEALRVQSVKDMHKLARIPSNWTIKLESCHTQEERKKVNADYGKKFAQAEKIESASYKEYYDYVNKNFTSEQQKKAMAESKDFMSKKYTNALRKNTK